MNSQELLADARAGLERLEPADAQRALENGALLIDLRADSQRERDGLIPGARALNRKGTGAIRSSRRPTPRSC
jgi:hypothetical protein